MQYWLMKSEPEVFGIEHLEKSPKQTTHWDGVRNYQVQNMMRDEMRKGDLAFFYHSNCKQPGIVGVMEVVREGYPDHTAFDPDDPHFDPKSDPDKPRWYMVDVKFRERFPRTVTLAEMRESPVLQDMLILRRGNRLSVTPITATEWKHIVKLAKSK